MYDETIRFDRYFPKTLNLHSISKNSEFMIYLNINREDNSKKNSRRINVLVNTGLFEKSKINNKCLYERDLSFKLYELLTRYLFFDPVVIKFINVYIMIIKHSNSIKLECLKGSLYAIRELFGKTMRTLTIKKNFPYHQENNLNQLSLAYKRISKCRCLISVIFELNSCIVCNFITEGLLSLNFLIKIFYYSGNFKWILNIKR